MLFKLTSNKTILLLGLMKMLIKVDVSLLVIEEFIHHLKFKSYSFFCNLKNWTRETEVLFVCLCVCVCFCRREVFY